jgi:hypothetical protein
MLAVEEFFGREKDFQRMKKLLLDEKSSVLIPGPGRWAKPILLFNLHLKFFGDFHNIP